MNDLRRDRRTFRQGEEILVLLTTGSLIVYPSQGPCLIGPIIEKVIDGRPLRFYQLLVLNGGGGELFIPVSKAEAIGIRPLLRFSEIPQLLDRLAQPISVVDNYRQRHVYILKLLASGSAFDLAEAVGLLTESNKIRPLSFGENKTFERAKELLVCEIAEVMGTSKEAAKAQIEAALAARDRKAQADAPARRRMANSRNQVRYQAASG
jgi:CarD family transcriptional regulator